MRLFSIKALVLSVSLFAICPAAHADYLDVWICQDEAVQDDGSFDSEVYDECIARRKAEKEINAVIDAFLESLDDFLG